MKKTIDYYEKIDETQVVMEHPSGLKVYIIPKKNYSKKFVYFFTRYGALHNEFIDVKTNEQFSMPLGIAHFLEHKLFENAENGVFEQFSNLGASVNAFTNFLATAYTFSTVDNFHESLGNLIGFVQNPYLTHENVEKEKGIICQEIKMYEDDADWVCYFNMLKSMYLNHPVKNDIAGTVESVNSTTKEELLKCYKSFYNPKNMGIVIVGDVDESEVYETVDMALTDEFKSREFNAKVILPEEPDTVLKNFTETYLDISQPTFTLGYKCISSDESVDGQMEKAIAARLLLDSTFGRGSSFYQKSYEEGIINNTFGYDYNYGEKYAFLLFSCETDDYMNAVNSIRGELESLKINGVSADSFDLAKRKAIGKYISLFNSTKYLSNSYLSHLIKGGDIFKYLDILNDMTLENAIEKFTLNLQDNEVLSVVRKEEK